MSNPNIELLTGFSDWAHYHLHDTINYFSFVVIKTDTLSSLKTVHSLNMSQNISPILAKTNPPYARHQRLPGSVFYKTVELQTQPQLELVYNQITKKTPKRGRFKFFFEIVNQSGLRNVGYFGLATSLLTAAFAATAMLLISLTFLLNPSMQLLSNQLFLTSLDSSYGFVEAEKEVGAIDDIFLPLVFVLLASIGWFFLLNPHHFFSSFESFWDCCTILFFCYLIISLPVNLLYECGFFFSTFFRGSANSTISLLEFMYDLIANMTMFARMQVQHVRVILGLAMYVELSTFVESLSVSFLFESSEASWISQYGAHTDLSSIICSGWILSNVTAIAVSVLEVFHYIVFLIQSSASYAALIFWLFSLLYASFVKDTTEYYFAVKNTLKTK